MMQLWTAGDLGALKWEHGTLGRKSDGAMVVWPDDVADAITRRDRDDAREAGKFPWHLPGRNSLD